MDDRITAMVSDAEGISQTARAAGFEPEALRETASFLRVQSYIAFSMGTPDATLKSWSSAQEELKKEGVFEQLFRKYYPNKPLPEPAVISSRAAGINRSDGPADTRRHRDSPVPPPMNGLHHDSTHR